MEVLGIQVLELVVCIIVGVGILKELFHLCVTIHEYWSQRSLRRNGNDVELGVHPSWKRRKAAELKDHLDPWLKETHLPAGINFDDHSLFILMPEDQEEYLKKSLKKEMRKLQDSNSMDYCQIITHKEISFERDQDYVGAGSSIYYKDERGEPVRSSFGVLLEDVRNHKRYILTTTHLADKRGAPFFFSNEQDTFELGICVAHVCQSKPLVEACLVEVHEDAYDRLSTFLSINGTQAEYVIRGPYTGDMHAILKEQREVLKAGGKTGLTRGWMKSADFDFHDPKTGNRMYSTIVTLPTDGNFADRGDSGAVICTSTCQAFTVDSWHNARSRRAQNPDTYVTPSTNAHTSESAVLLQEDGAVEVIGASKSEAITHVNDCPDVERHARPCYEQLTGRERPRVVQAERQILTYGYHSIPPNREVMAHEALSVHNFGCPKWKVKGTFVRASLSFKLDTAMKLLQEQIGGNCKLVLVPLLRESYH